MNSHLDNDIAQVAAHHLKQVVDAANQYVQEHHHEFSVINPSNIPFDSLVTNGYLPSWFLPTNSYGQSYTIMVVAAPSGSSARLQVLVTTSGGSNISEAALRKITNRAGPTSGYVSVLAPGKITGNNGVWELDNDDNTPVAIGHLASLSLVDKVSGAIDAGSFLRRVSIPGHPEYNKMSANLELAEDKKIFFGNALSGFSLSKGKIKYGTKVLLTDKLLYFNNADNINLESNSEPGEGVILSNSDYKAHLTSSSLFIKGKGSNSNKSAWIGAESGSVGAQSFAGHYSSLDGMGLRVTKDMSSYGISSDTWSKLEANELSFNGRTVVTADFIDIPKHTVGNITNHNEINEVAINKVKCKQPNGWSNGVANSYKYNIGRLFMVHEGYGYNHAYNVKSALYMCVYDSTRPYRRISLSN